MKKTNNLGFIGCIGFIGFLGFRAGNHPQWAYLSFLSFGAFLAFVPKLEPSKAKWVLHPTRKWFLLSLFSLFFLFFLFSAKPDLSALAFLSFLSFLAATKPPGQPEEKNSTDSRLEKSLQTDINQKVMLANAPAFLTHPPGTDRFGMRE